MQLKMQQERLGECEAQVLRLQKDRASYQQQLSECEEALTVAQSARLSMAEATRLDEAKRQALLTERDHIRQALRLSRETLDQNVTEKHELEIRVQTSKSQIAALKQHCHHLETQHAAFLSRQETIQQALRAMPVLETVKTALTQKLNEHVGVESELTAARENIETLNEIARALEKERQATESESYRIRSTLEALRIEMNAYKIKMEGAVEKITETNFVLEELLQALPETSELTEWQNKVLHIAQRIQRLGAINLIAIDEYATCQERKTYLDKQLEDLQTGLNTLEEAIGKIDKEIRVRFQETFDKVNRRFQELFPLIFGGGRANLECDNDNLLEAGILLTACPPGKRNSSIYLLSGGEKTLTALAFIFSIFYLNPAPFCLLDEVDAALDDMNVIRFTKLVKSMSDRTQFIFVSHNKVTIEMGMCLIGVTMHEPGVSRLVSVDIETAMKLAEPATAA